MVLSYNNIKYINWQIAPLTVAEILVFPSGRIKIWPSSVLLVACVALLHCTPAFLLRIRHAALAARALNPAIFLFNHRKTVM